MSAPQDPSANAFQSANRRDIQTLVAIVARLRHPEYGCPWDLKQSLTSIVPHTLEEAYEVAASIELGDMYELRGELGDLLFQVAMFGRIAEEQGLFDFADIVESINDKMIRRHPHVFGDRHFNSEAEIRASWESIKAAERRAKSGQDAPPEPGSVLDGVAHALPAPVRAGKLQKRAAHVGFDWDDATGVIAKVREELEECEQAIAARDRPRPEKEAEKESAQDAVMHEVGDLLFSCVNLARHLGVDAEQALRGANQRFERRFRYVEAVLRTDHLDPGRAHRERMERLWQEAKQEEHRCGT